MEQHQNISVAEAELVERLRRQDEAALSLLYDKYSAALYGVVLRIVRQEGDSEEVMQEVFLRIWSSMAQYDPQRGKFFTWMINIARHAALDKIRSKNYRVSAQSSSLEDNPARQLYSDYEIRPDHVGLKEIVGKLNPDQRQVIDLMYFDGYTQSEVAEVLAIPLGTVKTRARAAIKFLTKLFR